MRVCGGIIVLAFEERAAGGFKMMMGVEEDAAMVAASSECSSACQSGWTTYLEDSSGCSCGGTTRLLYGKGQQPCYSLDNSEGAAAEEEDLSMISDASSGPRQQYSVGSDECAAAYAARRGRRMEPEARRQSKMAAVASLLEDTASSPAFFKCSKAMSSGETNGNGNGIATDFSCAFSATTSFKSPLNGSPLGRYQQVQYSLAPPVKAMPTRQNVCHDGVGKIKRW